MTPPPGARQTSKDWVHDLLAKLRQVPPVDTFLSKHSLHSAGASAALSIGVDVFTIARLGGWASIDLVPHLYSFLMFRPWLRKSLDAVLAAHRKVRSS